MQRRRVTLGFSKMLNEEENIQELNKFCVFHLGVSYSLNEQHFNPQLIRTVIINLVFSSLLNLVYQPQQSELCVCQFLSMCYSHFLLHRFSRNNLIHSSCFQWFYIKVLESEYCQQRESALNPFSSLLLYQKVIKTQPCFLAETLVCCDTAQRKVHLGLFTCCGTRKAIYPHLGHFTLCFSL